MIAFEKGLYGIRIRNAGRDESLVVLLFTGNTARGQKGGTVGLDSPVELVEGGIPAGSALPVEDPVGAVAGKWNSKECDKPRLFGFA